MKIYLVNIQKREVFQLAFKNTHGQAIYISGNATF
jgi:hypothetical protein